MRIVGGKFRGRALVGPKTDAIRPTSDRVREAIFNVLAHADAPIELDGANVIDLFAGTGALGIEALSRGASRVVFVEHQPAARALIQANIDALGLGGITRVFRRDATRLGDARDRFDLAFLDPPYGKGLGERALTALHVGHWLRNGATVVLEESTRVEVELPAGFTERDRRTYGDTQILLLTAG